MTSSEGNMIIGLCGNITLSFLTDELKKLHPGVDFIQGEFDQYAQELLKPQGIFSDANIVVVALDWREAVPEVFTYALGTEENAVFSEISAFFKKLDAILSSFKQDCSAKICIFTPISDWYRPTGFIDRLLPTGQHKVDHYLQISFNELCRKFGEVYPVDLEQIAQRIGKENVYDPRMRQLARAPYTQRMTREIAASIRVITTQITLYPLKCLIFDLDNTIWGGVIGEDGIENIELGELGIGRAYKEFQAEIKRLYSQGIFLAVCSKNNETDALDVFEKHPDMVLKRAMISSMRINWENKARNIKEIAGELNIGLDACMFVDDNPVEREMARAQLPQIEILELPKDPVYYAESLRKCTRFYPLHLTKSDREKGFYIQHELKRKESRMQSTTLEEHLLQSELVATIAIAHEFVMPRIAQLFYKTNQFNLTTKRYSQTELEGISSKEGNHLWYCELKDRFGDYGIIGVSLVCEDIIDSFLLSCRALGRKVECALLWKILNHYKQKGKKMIQGLYIPTQKNVMAASFYKDNGFIQNGFDGTALSWILDLTKPLKPAPEWITLGENKDDCKIN
jgi:FkbH-like protein